MSARPPRQRKRLGVASRFRSDVNHRMASLLGKQRGYSRQFLKELSGVKKKKKYT